MVESEPQRDPCIDGEPRFIRLRSHEGKPMDPNLEEIIADMMNPPQGRKVNHETSDQPREPFNVRKLFMGFIQEITTPRFLAFSVNEPGVHRGFIRGSFEVMSRD